MKHLLIGAALCLATACGSSGGGGGGVAVGAPQLTTAMMLPEWTLCAWITNDGQFDHVTCGYTGDLDGGMQGLAVRQIFTFSLQQLPSSAEVLSATLVLAPDFNPIFGDPFELGRLIIDHVNIGGALNASDYGGGTLVSNVGAPLTVAGNQGNANWYLDVTEQVRDDVAFNRQWSQYRSRFETESNMDGGNDAIEIENASEACDLDDYRSPSLIVIYRE